MKKGLVMLTALLAVSSLVACSNNGGTSATSATSASSSQTTSETPTSATSASSSQVTSEVTSSSQEARVLQSISATYNGQAIDYGGTVNKEDVAVTAHYSDSTTEPVTDFEMEYDSTVRANKVTVLVTYQSLTTTVDVPMTVVAYSISATYMGDDIVYGDTIARNKVKVILTYSDLSNKQLETTKYSVSVDSERRAGTYEDGLVTVTSGDGKGLTANFGFTIKRDHLPEGLEAVEAEISRMVKVFNPEVTDPEYHFDFKYNSTSKSAYFVVNGYETEKTDILEINKEVASLLDSGATASSVPYVDEDGGGYAEYFLSTEGLEMFIYNAVVEDKNMVQIGVFNSSKLRQWPAEEIARRVLSCDVDTTTVIPAVADFTSVEFDDSYVINRIHIVSSIMKEDGVGGYINPTNSYYDALNDAGWRIINEPGRFTSLTHTAISPDEKIVVEFGFNSLTATFSVVFYKNILGFPQAVVGQVFAALGSSATTMPVSDTSEFKVFSATQKYWSNYGIMDLYTTYSYDPCYEYSAAFTINGWTVTENYIDYFVFQKAAISPDKKVAVEFGYEKGYLYFYIYSNSETTTWDAAWVASIVSRLVPSESETVLPEFTGGLEYSYKYNSTYNVGLIDCAVTNAEEAIAAYATTLTDASYTEGEVTSEGDRVFYSPAKDLKVTVYESKEGVVRLQLESYNEPTNVWPSDKIAENTPDGVRDAIPSYSGEEVSSYEVSTSGNLAVLARSSDVTLTMSAYAEVCIGAGYVNDAAAAESYGLSYVLVSENEDVTIYVYSSTEGIATFEFEFNPIITRVNLSGFLTKYGYPTDASDAFADALGNAGVRFVIGTNTDRTKEVLLLRAPSDLLQDALTWAQTLGFNVQQPQQGVVVFYDASGHEVDIINYGTYVAIQIWGL